MLKQLKIQKVDQVFPCTGQPIPSDPGKLFPAQRQKSQIWTEDAGREGVIFLRHLSGIFPLLPFLDSKMISSLGSFLPHLLV